MRLVIPAGAARRQTPRQDPVLIKAVTRAHVWKDRLLSGNAPSLRAIASAEGLRESYVGRIVRLAFLAPDIIEAFLDGHQPADLDLRTLTWLRRMRRPGATQVPHPGRWGRCQPWG